MIMILMQFFLCILTLLLIDTFLSHFSFNLIQEQYINNNKNIVYIQHIQFTKHGLSTVEAQIWGFSKHAEAQPKKGVAYKIKNVYSSSVRQLMTQNKRDSLVHKNITDDVMIRYWRLNRRFKKGLSYVKVSHLGRILSHQGRKICLT